VRKRAEMHDGGTAVGRTPDRGEIQEIIAVGAVKADDIVAEVPQMTGYRPADVTEIPCDQNPHGSMIGR
jgi:hypothetical protein